MTTEEWRPVAGLPDYEVSSLGRVRSYRRISSGKLLKGSPNGIGYRSFSLFDSDGKPHTFLAHHLVARAFFGERPPGLDIRHLDGDGLNNVVTNLRYGTRSENLLDAVRHGTHAWAKRTHCKSGHPFDEANTRRTTKQRICRTCRREANRRYEVRRAQRAAGIRAA